MRWLSVGLIEPAACGHLWASSVWSALAPRVSRSSWRRSADLVGDGRAQVQLGERGAQVQAGAADDDRPPAGRQQSVDLLVRQRGRTRRR